MTVSRLLSLLMTGLVAVGPINDTLARLYLPIQLGEDAGVVLDAVVDDMGDDNHPALSLVRLKLGDSPVMARLTRRSAVGLGLLPGLPAWVQIKAVALIG